MTERPNLDDLDRLAEGATPGPWFEDEFDNAMHSNVGVDIHGDPLAVTEWVYRNEDREFIAAARTAVPALNAALRAVLALDTGNNRALYGNDFEAGMAKALWLVKGAIEQHVEVDR